MEYRYTETSSTNIALRLTVQQVTDLLTMSRALMADTEEARAALATMGWSRWDVRKLRDEAQTVLQSVAESMKYEAQALEAKASA